MEAKFCEDYIVRFLLMYNVIDKEELEELETTKSLKEDSIFRMSLQPDDEDRMLDIIDKEYEQAIGKLIDELKTQYPQVIGETIMQLNKLLIQNQLVASKLSLRVPQSISQALPSLDYFHNYEKCLDNLQKLEILGMK